MADEQSSHAEILKSMLRALAKRRNQNGAWTDAEEEVSGSQVFKIGEMLRPFYLVAAQELDVPVQMPLDLSDLAHDTKVFFSGISKHGFFPSPYSAAASEDQYVDFAAFSLEFSELVIRFPAQLGAGGDGIKKTARACFQKALEFLINPKNYLADADGVRWAGTPAHSRPLRKGKATEFFTDTYFTANAVMALNRAREIESAGITQERKSLLTELIQKAGHWIAGRAKGLLTGDEQREKPQLFYTTWGIRALAETYHLQEASVRDSLKAVSATYLQTLAEEIQQKNVKVAQNYIYVFSTDLATLLPYEERASWAGVLLALISLSRIQELEATLEGAQFREVLDAVYNGVLALRDPVTDLWYRDHFIISIHSPLAEALISLSGLPARLGYTYEVTSAMLDRAVNDAIVDPRYTRTIKQLVFEKLSQLASRRHHEERMSRGLSRVKKTLDTDAPDVIKRSKMK